MENKKRAYIHKNSQPTLKDIDIYEDFVTELLENNTDYFAIKAGYWDVTRTVYSLKQSDIKSLKEEQKILFDEVIETGFKKNQSKSFKTKKLINKLDEVCSKINDLKKGKKFYHKIINFKEWKDVMYTLNYIIQDKIIEGEKYKITGLGFLEMVCIERSARNLLKYSYIDAEDYVLLKLNKTCRFKNRKVYYARPVFGNQGTSFKCRIFETIAKRPELKARYKFISRKEITEYNIKAAIRNKKYKESLLNKDGSL